VKGCEATKNVAHLCPLKHEVLATSCYVATPYVKVMARLSLEYSTLLI